jgi:hypothetical protein
MVMYYKQVDHKFVHKCEEGQSIFLLVVGNECSFLECLRFVSNSEPGADVSVAHLVFVLVMTAKTFSTDLEIMLVQSLLLQTQCIKFQIFWMLASVCFICHSCARQCFFLL